jgi:hypothetical protein
MTEPTVEEAFAEEARLKGETHVLPARDARVNDVVVHLSVEERIASVAWDARAELVTITTVGGHTWTLKADENVSVHRPRFYTLEDFGLLEPGATAPRRKL